MRLIDVEALIDDCKKYLNKLNPSRDCKECSRMHWLIGILSKAPTIEPERKTGKWHYSDTMYNCDQCGSGFYEMSAFCPNCGADMRGESDGSD